MLFVQKQNSAFFGSEFINSAIIAVLQVHNPTQLETPSATSYAYIYTHENRITNQATVET